MSIDEKLIDEKMIALLEDADRTPVVKWHEVPTGIQKFAVAANIVGAEDDPILENCLPVLEQLSFETLKMPFSDPRKYRLGKVLESLIFKIKKRLGDRNAI